MRIRFAAKATTISATIHNVTEITPVSDRTVKISRSAMATKPTIFFFLRNASGPELFGADIWAASLTENVFSH